MRNARHHSPNHLYTYFFYSKSTVKHVGLRCKLINPMMDLNKFKKIWLKND